MFCQGHRAPVTYRYNLTDAEVGLGMVIETKKSWAEQSGTSWSSPARGSSYSTFPDAALILLGPHPPRAPPRGALLQLQPP